MKRSAVLGAVFALLATSVWAAPDTVLEKNRNFGKYCVW